jgi:hypothetical protein
MSTTKFARRKTMENACFENLGEVVRAAMQFALDHNSRRPNVQIP